MERSTRIRRFILVWLLSMMAINMLVPVVFGINQITTWIVILIAIVTVVGVIVGFLIDINDAMRENPVKQW